jgi:hypothetical protein
MNPDVAQAVDRLESSGALMGETAASLRRTARRELVSVRLELRLLLYLGVTMIAGGVGLFFAEHHRQVGPAVVAALAGAVAAACLAYAFRRAPAFTWEATGAQPLAYDYALLLALLLAGADLAYLESQFSLLGAHWPHHLLALGLLALLAAYRFDSRTALSLALSSLAAWRGLSLYLLPGITGPLLDDSLRTSALLLGALYIAAAAGSVLAKRKAHFEPVYAPVGLALLLGGLFSGTFAESSVLWILALLAVAGAVMYAAFRLGRLLDFALGTAALWLGLLRSIDELIEWGDEWEFLTAAVGSLLVLGLILWARRRMKGGAP